MTRTPGITRPPRDLIDALKDIGAAKAAGRLGHMGSAARTSGTAQLEPGEIRSAGQR